MVLDEALDSCGQRGYPPIGSSLCSEPMLWDVRPQLSLESLALISLI